MYYAISHTPSGKRNFCLPCVKGKPFALCTLFAWHNDWNFAIIAVFTAVDSMSNKIRNSVKSLGEDVIFVQKWPWVPEGAEYAWWKYMNRPVPKIAEIAEIERRMLTIDAVVYSANLNATIYYKTSFIENVSVVATTIDYNKVKTFDLAAGRYFTPQECGVGNAVALIGSNIAMGIFHNEDPIGKKN